MAPAPAPQVAVASDQLIGKWGLAAYRVDTDFDRTKGEARRACSNPYVVGPGPGGGVMMHLADQATPTELVLKTGGDGNVYLGPPGKAGDPRDRQIMSNADGVIVMRWIDPSVATRYGTMVYVRCAVA